MPSHILKNIVFAILMLALVACAQMPILHDLSENDANEILVVLHDRGIEAQKLMEEKSQEITWSVRVAKKDAATSRKVLLENNLPKKKQLGFSGICKEKGLIPTPEEEKCRRILALKGEIINSLEKIPGVIDADVVLNIPDISEFSVESQPAAKRPTASAVLRVRKTPQGLDITEPKVQRFISNTVENLDPRDVSAVITYILPPEEIIKNSPTKKLESVAGLNMDPDSKNRFQIYALCVLALLIAISGALVFSLLKLTRLRKELRIRFGAALGGGGGDSEAKLLQGPEGGMAHQIPAAGQTMPKI